MRKVKARSKANGSRGLMCMKVAGVGASFTSSARPPHSRATAAMSFATRNAQYFIFDWMPRLLLKFQPLIQFGIYEPVRHP